MTMREHTIIEELRFVVDNYPVEPTDAISFRTAAECEKRRWIVRDVEGRFIPTAEGLRIYYANPQ